MRIDASRQRLFAIRHDGACQRAEACAIEIEIDAKHREKAGDSGDDPRCWKSLAQNLNGPALHIRAGDEIDKTRQRATELAAGNGALALAEDDARNRFDHL